MNDGFVKRPDAALRFTLRRCSVRNSTPHSSGFARLACGLFTKPSCFRDFYDFFMISESRKATFLNKITFLLIFIFILAGCASRPAPVWIASGHQQLENFKTDFLIGRAPHVTELHFKRAVEELKKGGDPDLLGKAWLTRMALQTAVLSGSEEGDYPLIEAARSVPANRNFYLFLKGDPVADASLLPERYRPFLKEFNAGNAAGVEKAIAAIEDPLSRLIAAGLAERRRLVSEAMLESAVETAAREGWKRALIAWLERLRAFHEAAGETAKAAAVSRRLEIIQ